MNIKLLILNLLLSRDVIAWFCKSRHNSPTIIGILGEIYGRHQGRAIAITIKPPGVQASNFQQKDIEDLLNLGVYAFVATSEDDVIEQLDRLMGCPRFRR